MKKIQKQVDEWVKQLKIGYFKPLEILARLTEEVGELAREAGWTSRQKILEIS